MADETLYRQLILSPGYDTKTGVFGLVCSADNGQTFKVYWTPYGRVWYPEDAKSFLPLLWPYIEEKIKAGGFKQDEVVNWSDIQGKPDVALKSDLPDLSKFAKISDIPKVDLSGYAKITDIPSDLVHTKDLADYVKTKDLPKPLDLSGYALKSQIPSLDGYAKLTDIPSLTGYLKQSALADYATKEDLKAIQLTPGPPGTPGADGKTSYFHIAYANSADGKDGFFVGGGVNLLQGTSTASGDVANGNGTFVKGAFNGYDAVKTNGAWSERFIDLKSALGRTNAKAGDWYTISVYVKADKQINDGFLGVYRALGNVDANTNDGFLDSIPMQNKPITTQWQQYSWSFQINDISLQRQITRVEYSQDTGTWIYWAGWMLEEGTVAHPWSPAPSEAHPLYMGTYTDFTQADSLDPTDYQWSQIKGDKGDRGPQGPPGQDATITIDSSSQTTNKKPSEYPEGFFHEVKDVSTLGIDRSHIAPELQQGHYALVTTKKYSGYARQVAEVLDSSTPATFVRNGEDSTWYDWLISQLTAY